MRTGADGLLAAHSCLFGVRAVSSRRLVASSPRLGTAMRLLPRVRCTGRHEARRARTVTGLQLRGGCGGRSGVAGLVSPRVRGADPARAAGCHGLWLKWNSGVGVPSLRRCTAAESLIRPQAAYRYIVMLQNRSKALQR
ncbi:MAG: hypothetical protein MI924_05430 [Chloroflexales bacterium]|nr:hypothetical protein [Chloroflexales bacterium]